MWVDFPFSSLIFACRTPAIFRLTTLTALTSLYINYLCDFCRKTNADNVRQNGFCRKSVRQTLTRFIYYIILFL